MHGDEAVNAVKVSELIEGDEYKYDPYEYHGPTLNYFSLITAWLYGANSFVDLNEEALRILPVLFGLFLLVIIYSLRDALGAQAVLFSFVFIAVSPKYLPIKSDLLAILNLYLSLYSSNL